MDIFIMRVQVIGNVYHYVVNSEETAETHIKNILKNGYRHFEGNASIFIPPERIINVSYKKETTRG